MGMLMRRHYTVEVPEETPVVKTEEPAPHKSAPVQPAEHKAPEHNAEHKAPANADHKPAEKKEAPKKPKGE
jgi:hypothetical protein